MVGVDRAGPQALSVRSQISVDGLADLLAAA